MADEQYRGWLVDLMKTMAFEKVFLVTIRRIEEQAWTLESIRQKLNGWQPDEVFFCTKPTLRPEQWKERVLTRQIFPRYGNDSGRYLAIESNLDTHKMYARYNIRGLKVFPSAEDLAAEGRSHDSQYQRRGRRPATRGLF